MKRQEIEKLLRIFQRSEKIKKDLINDKIIQFLCKTNITLEEMERVDEILKYS